MDPDELDKLEQDVLNDQSQTPPFDAGGAGRNEGNEPDSDQQLSDALPDDPQSDTNVDETEFYNEGEAPDNKDAEDLDMPDVDSYEDPAKQ